jgi:hypothetical protein
MMAGVSIFLTKALFEYPGAAEALLHGLNAEHQDIVTQNTITLFSIVVNDSFPDNDILTTHPDLVTAVVNTFCKQGISVRFECELLKVHRSPLLPY